MSARAYRAIRDYGIIRDCHSAALVSSTGSIDWWCPARFDAPSVFARLLDLDRGGHGQILPMGRAAVERTYVPQTNALRTSFRTSRCEAPFTDFMPMSAAAVLAGGEATHAPHVGRTVACATGHVELELEFAPHFACGGDVGSHSGAHGRHGEHWRPGAERVPSLFTEVPLNRDDDRLMARFDPRAGERAHFLAIWPDSPQPDLESAFELGQRHCRGYLPMQHGRVRPAGRVGRP